YPASVEFQKLRPRNGKGERAYRDRARCVVGDTTINAMKNERERRHQGAIFTEVRKQSRVFVVRLAKAIFKYRTPVIKQCLSFIRESDEDPTLKRKCKRQATNPWGIQLIKEPVDAILKRPVTFSVDVFVVFGEVGINSQLKALH